MPRRGGRDRYRTKTQIKNDRTYTAPRMYPIELTPALAEQIVHTVHATMWMQSIVPGGAFWTTLPPSTAAKPVRRPS